MIVLCSTFFPSLGNYYFQFSMCQAVSCFGRKNNLFLHFFPFILIECYCYTSFIKSIPPKPFLLVNKFSSWLTGFLVSAESKLWKKKKFLLLLLFSFQRQIYITLNRFKGLKGKKKRKNVERKKKNMTSNFVQTEFCVFTFWKLNFVTWLYNVSLCLVAWKQWTEWNNCKSERIFIQWKTSHYSLTVKLRNI